MVYDKEWFPKERRLKMELENILFHGAWILNTQHLTYWTFPKNVPDTCTKFLVFLETNLDFLFCTGKKYWIMRRQRSVSGKIHVFIKTELRFLYAVILVRERRFIMIFLKKITHRCANPSLCLYLLFFNSNIALQFFLLYLYEVVIWTIACGHGKESLKRQPKWNSIPTLITLGIFLMSQ
jgi:hypothetical protein